MFRALALRSAGRRQVVPKRVPKGFNKDNYCTTLAILALVYAALRGPADLDPCSHVRSQVISTTRFLPAAKDARRFGIKPVDGLKVRWEARTVFMNPPYSCTSLWIDKFLEWFRQGGQAGVMLLSAETGLVYWQKQLLPAVDRMSFLPRVAFLANGVPIKGNRCNSVLLYCGDEGRRVGRIWPTPVWRPCAKRREAI